MLPAELDLLVISAQEGSEDAFRLIFMHYHKGLVRYALKVCGDLDLAQDAVQEAWLKMTGNLHKLEDPRKFRGFIYQLVHWRCLDLLRKKNRLTEVEEPLESESEFSATLTVAADETIETVSVLIKRLPPLERQMLHLFYLEDLQVNEIARVLGIPAGTVKSRLNRARNLLKERYNDND